MNKVKVDTNGKLELYTVDDFLTYEECEYVVKHIDENNYRSSVTHDNDDGATVCDYRTSDSSALATTDQKLKEIDNKIHELMGIPLDKGEGIQGQRYKPGQYFKDHTDFFDGPEAKQHIGDMGQRNWTCMVYLSDVEEGGETDFPRVGKTFFPKRGQAVIWNSLYPDQKGNPDSLHAGRPPVKGVKYVITKWFRNGIPFEQPANGTLAGTPKVEIPKVELKTYGVEEPTVVNGVTKFSKIEHMPKFTEEGFKVVDVPKESWNLIQDIYSLIKHTEADEKGVEGFVVNVNGKVPSTILNMDHVPNLKQILHKQLKSTMEEWIGNKYKLEPATCYGIRSYQNGTVLGQHTDRLSELHVSGIILVDEKSNEPWGLNILDHQGKQHEVVIKPGQMILYESARLFHGRDKPFNGEYFRNFFIHYKLKNWEQDAN